MTPKPPVRVLHCITRLGLGGSERVALSIIRGFRGELTSGVFTVYGAANDPVGAAMQEEVRREGTPWFRGTRVPIKAGGMITGGFQLARAIRKFRPDIIHFHSETPEAAGAMMLRLHPRHRQVPLVRTIHNSVFWRYWPRVGRWCDRQLAQARIACVSSAAREEFQRYRRDSGVTPPSEDPPVIYNGVDIAPAPPRTAPLDPSRRRILFAGRFEPQKGTDLIAECLASTRLPDGVAGELVLAGHGTHKQLLRNLAARPPAGWTIDMRPPVPRLTDYLLQFDVFLLPSRFEGLGLTAIEASLTGIVVVATAAPGLREALPSDYPWLATPGDATSLATILTHALHSPESWRPAIESAQRYATARFSPSTMIAGYRQLYARCLANRPC